MAIHSHYLIILLSLLGERKFQIDHFWITGLTTGLKIPVATSWVRRWVKGWPPVTTLLYKNRYEDISLSPNSYKLSQEEPALSYCSQRSCGCCARPTISRCQNQMKFSLMIFMSFMKLLVSEDDNLTYNLIGLSSTTCPIPFLKRKRSVVERFCEFPFLKAK